MVLEYSPDGNLLYVRLRQGEVVETAEFQSDVYVDLDDEGRPVGVEYLNADGFFPFLKRLAEGTDGSIVEVPGGLRAMLDRRYGVLPPDDPLAAATATATEVATAP